MKKIILVIMAMAMIGASALYADKANAPGLNKVPEFVPFTHEFNMPYVTEDYEAIANQTVVHIGDVVKHIGRKYVALQNHSTYPDEFNVNGNPFTIISDKAYDGGYYYRVKSNEPTCIEKVFFSNFDDINDMGVWKVDWYQMEAFQTDGCSGYPDMLPYFRTGQTATALYGAVALGGWTFRINDILYYGYKRDVVIVPTPNTPEALGFWEKYKK